MLSFNEWQKKKTISTKQKLLQRWASLNYQEHKYIPMNPKGPKGTSYDDDGVRITGTQEFIDSILVRIKDLLTIEQNNQLQLDVRFDTVQSKDPQRAMMPRFAMYINAKSKSVKV